MFRAASLSFGIIAGIAVSLALAPALAAQSVILPEGMVVHLETRGTVSSKTARKGDRVELAVARPVVIGGITLIPAGTPAEGQVMRASGNGLLGRSGKLDIQVSSIRVGAVDVPVRGEQNSKGKSGTLESVGAGIVFLPLAVIVHGRNVTLPAKTPFDVYVDREITMSSPAPAGATEGTGQMPDQPPPSPIRTIDPDEAAGVTR